MFREVALRADLPDLEQRANEIAKRYPSPGAFGAQLRAAGFTNVSVEEEVFRMPFRNAKVLFTDPVVRFVGLPEWRWIAGFDPRGPEHMDEVERCLDTYVGGGPISLTVNAGLVSATG